MKQAGKAHWLTIAGILSIFVVAGLFFFAKDPVAKTANDFMVALAKGDVDTLTELSSFQGASKEELKEKWRFTVKEVAPHYMFAWKILSIARSDENTAAARLMVRRNADQGGFDENFQLPLVKENGEWKVDVRSISRAMYPGLPQ
jgi:hypothetical protein